MDRLQSISQSSFQITAEVAYLNNVGNLQAKTLFFMVFFWIPIFGMRKMSGESQLKLALTEENITYMFLFKPNQNLH